MPKYYRVRSQQEWDWLMQWFEKESKNIRWVNGSEKPSNIRIRNSIIKDRTTAKAYLYIKHDVYDFISYGYDTEMHTHDFIEVSQMMEDEKMEDYVTIYGKDAEQIRTTSDGQVPIVKYHEPSGRLTPIFDIADGIDIPKSLLYPKVKFTEEEKKEFDDVKKHVTALYNAMVLIFEHRDECINLNNKLFYSAPPKYLNDVQRDFARAWTDPSLIDVIPEKKYWVKCYPTDDCYFYKYDGKILAGMPRVHLERFHFTAKEITDYHLDGNTFEKVEVGDAKEN